MNTNLCLDNTKTALLRYHRVYFLEQGFNILTNTAYMTSLTFLSFLAKHIIAQQNKPIFINNKIEDVATFTSYGSSIATAVYLLIKSYHLSNLMVSDCIDNLQQYFDFSEKEYNCSHPIFTSPKQSYSLCKVATLNFHYLTDLEVVMAGAEL